VVRLGDGRFGGRTTVEGITLKSREGPIEESRLRWWALAQWVEG
jgi:hypothetical protein